MSIFAVYGVAYTYDGKPLTYDDGYEYELIDIQKIDDHWYYWRGWWR